MKIGIALQKRISALVALGEYMGEAIQAINDSTQTESKLTIACNRLKSINGFYDTVSISNALQQWHEILTEERLTNWLHLYPTLTQTLPQRVALIMAANIPLVGFHDFISILLCGHKVMIRKTKIDEILYPPIIDVLIKNNSEFEDKIEMVEGKLSGFDAIIATGSNNTNRYFQEYFGAYPNILRHNRHSVAILDGNETEADLKGLTDDMMLYYGMGCRSISKVYVPVGYDLDKIFEATALHYPDLMHNAKYADNYAYYRAYYLLHQEQFLENGSVMLMESEHEQSPISVIYYEYYKTKKQVVDKLKHMADDLQCIVCREPLSGLPTIPTGQAQAPTLTDYADGKDTLSFLTQWNTLNKK